MPKDIVVLGGPGAGKTTAMVTTTKGWFEDGLSVNEVAYLAFTKAAAREAAGRILDEDFKKDHGDRLPYCRTLHSLAFSGLKQQKKDVRVVTTADMKGFSKWSSMEGKYSITEFDDMADLYRKLQERGQNTDTEWDECLAAYTLSRISARSAEDLTAAKHQMSNFACKAMGPIEPDVYTSFVEKYESYKSINNLADFTDMLEFALTEMEPPKEVRRMVVDESQDLSPLLQKISDRLFEHAEERWHAGDDDQAIFAFSAGDASLFIERARRSTQILLTTTRRFGQDVIDLSQEIIKRVSDRVPKQITGVAGREHTIRMTGDFKPFVHHDMMLLHRHVAGCQGMGAAYMAAGLPFRNERGKDPLGPKSQYIIMAYKALRDLADGKSVSLGAATRLIDDLMPSTIRDERKTGNKSTRLVVHGAKKKLQNATKEGLGGEANIMDLMMMKILTEEGAEVIRQKFFNVFEHSENLEYYEDVTENGYDLEGACPIISTIHGSKGREAEKVVLFSEMGQRCWDDPDTEHRLAYVGATRTKKDLDVCMESTLPWRKVTHYNYPIKNKAPYMTSVDTPGE